MSAPLRHHFEPAPPVPLEILAARRKRLLDRIGDGIVVIPAAPELLKSRDTEVRYRQSSDFFYFTGFPEPESLAVLRREGGSDTLTLFVRERDPDREVWTGSRIGVDGARASFGADAAYAIADLRTRLPELLKGAEAIHYPIGQDLLLDGFVREALLRARRTRPRSGTGPTAIVDLDAASGPMRLVKDAHEIARTRTAAVIAAAAHRKAMAITRPGIGEWEIEAAVESVFRASGAEGPSFPTIVGSGPNATVLHYVDNNRRVGPGELVLVDAGAEWGMYASDISRTFPADGRFSSAQADLYDVVLAAEDAGIAAARVGAPVKGVHEAALHILVQGMIDLGILPGESVDQVIADGSYRRFYMHQSSHWLGLDVHDTGPYTEGGESLLLATGMVLTVEPGLYIPTGADDVPEHFRGVGIRIEDDVVVTDGEPEILTRDVPVARAEIEALVGSDG